MPRLVSPARAIQLVLLTDAQQATESLVALNHALTPHCLEIAEHDRFFTCALGDILFAWERHSEFMTYSFFLPGEGKPFETVAEWMADMPGEIIRSTQIALVAEAPDDETVAAHFAFDDLIVSDVADGRARIWSDFRLHQDGFGRLMIFDRGLEGVEAAQLVQRLQELGNYRKMALLGLPEAQAMTPRLTSLEQRLTNITTAIAAHDANADEVLEDLSALSADLAQTLTSTRYRMSATSAYAQICLDRIRSLNVSPVRGYRSLDDFTERRLVPAMRTCDAFSCRLEDLSQRAAWTSGMLRTRIDTAIARRNRDLLASMDRRTGLQLRLQHTVEGLSVVAISYYALGLWLHFSEALEQEGVHFPGWAEIALIPTILVIAWLGIRQLKKVKRPGRPHE